MTARFSIHIEPAGRELVWWAETPAVSGLSIAAPSLLELRRLIDEAVALHLPTETDVDLELVVEEPEFDSDAGAPVEADRGLDVPLAVGTPARRSVALLPFA